MMANLGAQLDKVAKKEPQLGIASIGLTREHV